MHPNFVEDRSSPQTHSSVWAEPCAPAAPRVGWGYTLLGLLLIPMVWISAATLCHAMTELTREHAFWKSSKFYFFHLGSVMWIVAFLGFPRRPLVCTYVFGHEWTHAFTALLCGGKLLAWPQVSSKGGQVITDRSNVLILLSPYFIPFYAVCASFLFGLYQWITPPTAPAQWIFYGMLGFSWSFHVTFTASILRQPQPDFEKHGRFFSLLFIIFANLVVLALLLVLASPNLSLETLSNLWSHHFQGILDLFRDAL